MSDTPTDAPAPEGDSAGNDVNIKALREAAERGKADAARADAAERELAFAKAGVDTTSKIGGMLMQTYQGDLGDLDALKAEWAELNPTAAAPPQGQTDPKPTDAPIPEGFQDPTQQQEARDNLTGEPTGGAPNEGAHPVDAALEAFHAAKASGVPLEDRQTEALAGVLGAYFQGDSRVMFDRRAHQEAAVRASGDDIPS